MIDLGPEGGVNGGRVVARPSPKAVASREPHRLRLLSRFWLARHQATLNSGRFSLTSNERIETTFLLPTIAVGHGRQYCTPLDLGAPVNDWVNHQTCGTFEYLEDPLLDCGTSPGVLRPWLLRLHVPLTVADTVPRVKARDRPSERALACKETASEDVPIELDEVGQFAEGCVVQLIHGASCHARVDFLLDSRGNLCLDRRRHASRVPPFVGLLCGFNGL